MYATSAKTASARTVLAVSHGLFWRARRTMVRTAAIGGTRKSHWSPIIAPRDTKTELNMVARKSA
jgi:hypothetical protein